MNKMPVLQCVSLAKSYNEGPVDLEILKNINLTVDSGERISIIGTSGSGKTTLLNLLAGLDSPSGGKVLITGSDLSELKDSAKAALRNQSMGFVYQFHHLLPEFTALENVAIPLLLRTGVDVKTARTKAQFMLGRVGLEARSAHKPAELSGGERQRVAIARALVTEPALVLLDEPTGNLDQTTAQSIHELMLELSMQLSTAFIMVTHNMELALSMDKTYQLESGELKQVN